MTDPVTDTGTWLAKIVAYAAVVILVVEAIPQ